MGNPSGVRVLHGSPASRQAHGASTIRRYSLLLAAALLVSCGKSDSGVKPVAAPAAESAKPAAVQQPTPDTLDADLIAALGPAPAPSEPAPPELTDLEREAQRVMNLYPDLNAQELLNVPEVNPQLTEALKGLAANPQLQAVINSSVDLAARFKGMDGPPGAFNLNLDITGYDDARTQRMLSAVMSGQPRPIVQFLTEELGEASFEFSFTDAEKTGNGISIERNPNPPAPATNTGPDPD